jgi:predicted RNA-binding protein
MDYIDQALEKLKEWAGKLIEALLGPEPEAEPELIPIPVNEPQRRRAFPPS